MANAPFRFDPVIPKKPIHHVDGGAVITEMRRFGLGFQGRISKYPPARTAYVRTGTLGRGWTMEGPLKTLSDLIVKVGNKVNYAKFVQGFKKMDPRQKAVFASYGWQSAETAGEDEWDKRKRPIIEALQRR